MKYKGKEISLCYGDIVCLRKGKKYKAVSKSFLQTLPNGLMSGFYSSSFSNFQFQLESFFEEEIVPFPFGVSCLMEKISKCEVLSVQEKENGYLVTMNGEKFMGILTDGDSIIMFITGGDDAIQLPMINMLLEEWKQENKSKKTNTK